MEDKDILNEDKEVLKAEDNIPDTENETCSCSAEQDPSQDRPAAAKKEKRLVNMRQLVIVAIICSFLGGTLGFCATRLFPSAGSNDRDDSSHVSVADMSVLTEDGESRISAIAEKLSPSVVGIKTTFASNDFFTGQSTSSGEGSGIIYSGDGYIITNNHVIADALVTGTNELAKGSVIEVILPGRQDSPYTAEVVGRDEKTDIAVLKIDASGLPAAELGDSDDLRIGELAVAIGNPGGLDFMGTVSAGIISGLNRIIETENGNKLTLIQTDTAINPGNSGGPLCNSYGQVIGIINIKVVATGYEGLGFAIPINQAKEIADGLIQSGYITGRPLLGVMIDTTFTEDTAKQNDVPAGLLVSEVSPSGGAAAAGILVGDIITKFDGQAITAFDQIQDLKNEHKPGDTVEIEVYRPSEKSYETFSVTLTEDTGTS